MERYPGKQLFIDDFFIESLSGAHRVLNRPEKWTVEAPFDTPMDRPWERERTEFSGVHYDERNDVFRAYYRAWIDGMELVCAVDSPDGVNWERPTLGLVKYDGSKENNIVNCPAGSVLWDSHEADDEHRWKSIDNKPSGVGPGGEEIWQAFHSRDGYDWKPYPPGTHNRQKMQFNFGSPPETFGGVINPDARYIRYSQRGSGRRTRVLGRRDSEDYLKWSGLRTVIDQDLDDPTGTEFYGAGYDQANRTVGGLHIMMLYTFLTNVAEPYEIEHPERYWGKGDTGPRATAIRVDGLVDSQLAVSRDTVSWKRYREPFVARGEPEAWDWGMLFACAPILHNDQLYFFYRATNLTHNKLTSRLWHRGHPTRVRRALGLALLRSDGYVSVEADSYAPGILTTHRFRQEFGGSIRVNVDASAGELRYELLECTGKPIPGYTIAECDPVRTDALDAELSWNGVPGWPAISEERRARYPGLPQSEFYLKLRFGIAPGTKLYSVTLDPSEVTMWRVNVRGQIE